MNKTVDSKTFLKDVLICSLGAFGGPEAHFGVFMDQLVQKKAYINQDELVEMMALTAILPGPSSTQTIVAIGHHLGGPKLAILTLLVWALPAIIVMSVFSFFNNLLTVLKLTQDNLRYIEPMALAFMVLAAYRIGRKSLTKPWKFILFIVSLLISYFYRTTWMFPLLVIGGALFSVFIQKAKHSWHKMNLKPNWSYVLVLIFIAMMSYVLARSTNNPILFLFDAFYRYGYLVIGGGNVVIPYMVTDLVETYGLISYQDFLTGFGLVQGMPGPMFSFSAFVGGLVVSNQGVLTQMMAALISGLAIFMPGVLLIFFVVPLWSELKTQSMIKTAMEGVSVVATALMSSAALVLMVRMGINLQYWLILFLCLVALASKKIWTPLLVLGVLVLGFMM
jgi:chromate transporter